MSLLDVLSADVKIEEAFGTVIGQKGVGKIVITTQSGNEVIIKGELSIGKKCFYNRRNSTLISEAPDLQYTEFSVN